MKSSLDFWQGKREIEQQMGAWQRRVNGEECSVLNDLATGSTGYADASAVAVEVKSSRPRTDGPLVGSRVLEFLGASRVLFPYRLPVPPRLHRGVGEQVRWSAYNFVSGK